jgi:hypothetical protein
MLSHFKNWVIFGLACVALTLSCQWGFDHLLKRLTA